MKKKGMTKLYVSARKKLCWWSSNCIVVTSLTLANPPSTLVYKLRELTIDSPTFKYHESDNMKKKEKKEKKKWELTINSPTFKYHESDNMKKKKIEIKQMWKSE